MGRCPIRFAMRTESRAVSTRAPTCAGSMLSYTWNSARVSDAETPTAPASIRISSESDHSRSFAVCFCVFCVSRALCAA